MSTESQARNAADDDLRLLTAAEVAELLRISVRGVWRQVSTERFPKPVYVGRLARWPLRTIRNWMDQGCPPNDDLK